MTSLALQLSSLAALCVTTISHTFGNQLLKNQWFLRSGPLLSLPPPPSPAPFIDFSTRETNIFWDWWGGSLEA